MSTKVIEMGNRHFLAAFLLHGIEDARSSNPRLASEARDWLRTTGIKVAAYFKISPEAFNSWLSELPELPFEQLALSPDMWDEESHATQ